MKYKDLIKLVLDLHIGTLAITPEEHEKYLQYATTIVRDVYNTLAPLADWSTVINQSVIPADSYLTTEPALEGNYYCATCSVPITLERPQKTVLKICDVWNSDGEYYEQISKKDMQRLKNGIGCRAQNQYCWNGGATITVYHLFEHDPQTVFIEYVPDFDQTTALNIENIETTDATLPNTQSITQEYWEHGAIIIPDAQIPLPSECTDVLINGLLYLVYKDMPAATNRNNEEIAYARYQTGKKHLFNSYWYKQNNNWGG